MNAFEIVAASFGFVVIVAVLWNLRGYRNHGESSGDPGIPGGVSGDGSD